MNSSTFFTTLGRNNYIYDANSMFMLNIHPIIELIHRYNSICDEDMDQNLADFVMSKYPHTDQSEIQYYAGKYIFLKSSGFFQEFNVLQALSGKTTAQVVMAQIANLDNIVFQVTNECNFRCKYCCYGELYNNMTPAPKKPMDWNTVQTFFDFMIPYWNSSGNIAHEKKIMIGFYGGEPLLNFSLIQKIIAFCEQLELKAKTEFIYSITTNALLLNKYAQYLVEKDIRLLISLDGNEKNNDLRVDTNNQPTFQRVYRNIKKLKSEYPAYFDKKVEFNSVLNKNSNVEEVHQFIFNEFGKIPLIEPISGTEQNPDKQSEFKEMVKRKRLQFTIAYKIFLCRVA